MSTRLNDALAHDEAKTTRSAGDDDDAVVEGEGGEGRGSAEAGAEVGGRYGGAVEGRRFGAGERVHCEMK